MSHNQPELTDAEAIEMLHNSPIGYLSLDQLEAEAMIDEVEARGLSLHDRTSPDKPTSPEFPST